MSIVMLWNIRCSSRIFSVIYSWLIRKKTETIQNKYEMERDYIKSNNEKKKKSQFSVLNLITTELSFRPFREFSKTECARSLSLSFFLYLYISFCIYFCCKFIIFSPGSLRLFCFHPISSDFTRRPFVSFTVRTFRLIRFLFANSSGSHLGRKKIWRL